MHYLELVLRLKSVSDNLCAFVANGVHTYMSITLFFYMYIYRTVNRNSYLPQPLRTVNRTLYPNRSVSLAEFIPYRNRFVP